MVFFAKGKRGFEVKRIQFPLTLACATKVQGLTLNVIVVDMTSGRFDPGQTYVTFSRVKDCVSSILIAKQLKRALM